MASVSADERGSEMDERGSEMDAEDVVWSDGLPADVEANIQARLPLVSLMKSRSVCRAWNGAVASPAWLLEKRLELRAGVRDCVLFVVGFCSTDGIVSCVYDPDLENWYQLDRLPRWMQNLGPYSRQILELPAGSRSAGGGVLLSTMRIDHGDTRKVAIPHIGNPVANSWTSLPMLPDELRIRHVLGMFVDAQARCFQLVALEGKGPTYVLDSSRREWRVTTHALPAPETFNNKVSDQGVFVGTVLYCVAGDCIGRACNLLAYDLERESWSWLAVSTPSSNLDITFCSLINVQDRLVCVTLGLAVVRGSAELCLQIWELDFTDMSWMVVDTMPDPMFSEFLGKLFPPDHAKRFSWYRIKVVAQDCQVYLMQEDLENIVALDLRQAPGAWRWLPPWPYQDFAHKSLHCVDPWLDFGQFHA